MDNKNTDSVAETFIKHMLGESNIDIELEKIDYEIIEEHTLDVIAPYYTGVKYIYGRAPQIDLSNYPEVITVHKVYETDLGAEGFTKGMFFGHPGVYIWDSSTMDSYLQYVSLKTLYDNFTPVKSQTWKYLKPYVQLNGFGEKAVVLECTVRPTKLSDIDRNSSFYPIAKKYALALAKEVVGRTRSKFTINGAPYDLDGDRLLQEAQVEKQEALDQIIPPIRIF